MIPALNDKVLEDTLVKIEEVRNWSPRLVSELENTIRTGDDEALFRISPLKWAQEKSVNENEALDLFLHSAKAGLLQMEWNVICRGRRSRQGWSHWGNLTCQKQPQI